ncbi:hypothetical protein QBC40DRAFT_289364 [Triangularia verruculosa]|uniref:Uncharacterized protein n=1 Tax=Triangularia verruculosa TaxID=2587418 RepID=A0AAN6X877_9PEZI|nr:hypothetical protein QBC40DRAFT_289364 [Triangularia verruculosa]
MSEAVAASLASPDCTASPGGLARVDGLVERLASAFDAGLEFYQIWLQKQQAENSYHHHLQHTRSLAAQHRARPIKCAVSTSLELSGYRIQSTYQIAFTLIGPGFAAGDDQTRQALTTNLLVLESKIQSLCQTIIHSLHYEQPLPLPLNEVYQCSEKVRIQSVAALSQQYRRMASDGRPSLPQTLPVPRPKRMSALLDELDEADLLFPQRLRSALTSLPGNDNGSGSDRTTIEKPIEAESEDPVLAELRSNPPSPPLTPKARSESFWSASRVDVR